MSATLNWFTLVRCRTARGSWFHRPKWTQPPIDSLGRLTTLRATAPFLALSGSSRNEGVSGYRLDCPQERAMKNNCVHNLLKNEITFTFGVVHYTDCPLERMLQKASTEKCAQLPS